MCVHDANTSQVLIYDRPHTGRAKTRKGPDVAVKCTHLLYVVTTCLQVQAVKHTNDLMTQKQEEVAHKQCHKQVLVTADAQNSHTGGHSGSLSDNGTNFWALLECSRFYLLVVCTVQTKRWETAVTFSLSEHDHREEDAGHHYDPNGQQNPGGVPFGRRRRQFICGKEKGFAFKMCHKCIRMISL